jgi:hypothetical protein
MRKMLFVPAVLVLLTAASAENRLFLTLGASYIRPKDPGFRQFYGSSAIFPEVSVAIRLVRGVCLTGGAGKFSKDGTTPDLGFATHASQSFFSVGLGYILRVSGALCFDVEAGLAGLSYKEEALGAWVKGRKPGYKAEGGVRFMKEDGDLFVGLRFGYMSARVLQLESNITVPQPISLGGVKVMLCFGLQLFGEK